MVQIPRKFYKFFESNISFADSAVNIPYRLNIAVLRNNPEIF